MKVRRKTSRKADSRRRPTSPNYGGQVAPSPLLASSARAAKAQRKDGDVKVGSAIGVWMVRQQGLEIGSYLASPLEAECYAPDELSPLRNREAFTKRFHQHQQWVLVMTTGIAVRYLQGLLKDKESDPGVVVLDEGCRFAVSLSGGHEGGANQLAYRVANLVGAVPVITTATETLKPLVVGVGCRRGVSSEQIDSAIEYGLTRIQRSRGEVREIATIDLKQDEPGLKAWCDRNGVALRIIGRELVQMRPWVTQPSDWVRKSIGVDGVCEACALLATFRGRLLLPKTTRDGVAVAIVEESASAKYGAVGIGSARQKSMTACPTKPKLDNADRSNRPRKRGALHNQGVGEVGRTRTSTSTN
jgi:cobalt-precorrin 5A hydrolase